MDIRRVRFLVELAEHSRMAATAEALGYSASAVAQHIHALERELGVQLIEPAGRNVRLTPPARVLVEHARPIFADIEYAQTQVAASLTRPQGTVRIATFQTAAFTVVPRMITRLAADHPQVVVEFSGGENDQTLLGLVANRYDLVIFEKYPGIPIELDDSLAVELLVEDPLWLVVPRFVAESLDRNRHPLTQVSTIPWAMEPPGTDPRSWAMGLCQQAGFTPRIRYTTADTLVHLRLVQEGLAVALIPEFALLDSNDIAHRLPPLLSQPPPTRALYTATRRSASNDPAIVATKIALSEALDRGRVCQETGLSGSTRSGYRASAALL